VKPPWARWALVGAAAASALVVSLVAHWQEDILRTALDPKKPYQTYQPPAPPDYDQPAAWAVIPPDPARWGSDAPLADVFFVHPTSYDGGRNWNGPIGEHSGEGRLMRVMLPNYAGPFAQLGRIFAPRYRQASLYTALTLRDDAREARRFAYLDVLAAWRTFRARYDHGRPLMLVGVEQGGQLMARLLAEEVSRDEGAKRRLVGAYLIETPTLSQTPPLPACERRNQSGCMVAYAAVAEGDDNRLDQISRALVWSAGRFEPLNQRATLCVNPVSGSLNGQASQDQHLGAARAGRDALQKPPHVEAKLIAAACRDGLLRFRAPLAPWLQTPNRWADRWRTPSYTLFYADLEADAKARLLTLLGRTELPKSAPSINQSVDVRTVEIRPAT
jgi:hypothetical protein